MNKIQKLEMWCHNMDALLWEANKKGVPLIVKDMKNLIQKEDVQQVANDLNIKVNEKIILWIIMNYGEYQDNDPTASWNLVVEQMLYDIPEELSIKRCI